MRPMFINDAFEAYVSVRFVSIKGWHERNLVNNTAVGRGWANHGY